MRPEPPRGAELRDLLEEVVVRGEEERQPLAEPIDVEAGGARRLDVGDRVGERERHFLHRRRSGFADVVAADRDRVPVRQLALAPREDVRDDAQRVARRIDVGAARDVLLEDVVLNRARSAARAARPAAARRATYSASRMIAVALIVIDVDTRSSGIPSKSSVHVLDRVDRDADAADFARGHRMVGVVAHLRRQIERHAQAADALREQIAIPGVRFARRCRTRRTGASSTAGRGTSSAGCRACKEIFLAEHLRRRRVAARRKVLRKADSSSSSSWTGPTLSAASVLRARRATRATASPRPSSTPRPARSSTA